MGCFICNEELFYHKKSRVMECSICHKKKETHQWCKNEHFICFDCFYPLEKERFAKWKKEEADRVRNYTLLDVDLDKLRKTLDYYEKNTDCSNIVGSSFPDEYYEIFQLLPMDMSCIEYVDTLLDNQGGTIDSLNIYNMTLRDIIALISYMDAQDRIWATTSYFIRNGIAVKILRRLESLCMNKSVEELFAERTTRLGISWKEKEKR